VWNKFANGWIQGSECCPGLYEKSFLHENAEQGAAYIKVRSVTPFEASDVLRQEDEVILEMYDESGTLLGPVKELSDKALFREPPGNVLGTDRSGGAKVFILRFQD